MWFPENKPKEVRVPYPVPKSLFDLYFTSIYDNIPVKLNIFTRARQKVKESVSQLIFPYTLVSNEKEMVTKQPVLKHVLQHSNMLLKVDIIKSFVFISN